jgi:hypothetical protein
MATIRTGRRASVHRKITSLFIMMVLKTMSDLIHYVALTKDFALERTSASDAGYTRIRQTPGICPVVATAIVAAIGDGAAFRKGRELQHGSASCPASTRQVARRSCSASGRRVSRYQSYCGSICELQADAQ